jgi:glycine oxidase
VTGIKRDNDKRVAVIGGGIIGCLTALYLHRLGARPFILERRQIGQESSWAGAGILCPIHPWLYPDSFTRLVDHSLSLYPELSEQLQADTGMSIQLSKCGLMIPMFADDSLQHKQQALAWSQRFAWQVEHLNGPAARSAESVLAADVSEALLWPDVGQVRNPRLLQAVRRALDQSGVQIHEQAAVTGLLEDANGQISGVRLANGQQFEADAVLLAAGSWSGELAAQMDLDLSIEPVKGQIVLLRDRPGKIRAIIKHDDAYFVPRSDGRILVGASMERVGFQRGNTEEVVNSLLLATHRIAPGLKDAEIEQQWMGFRPGTADGLPFLGPVQNRSGLWVASGHYRNGVTLAPGTAEIMSRWILGEEPKLDMSDFRIERTSPNDAKLGFPESTDSVKVTGHSSNSLSCSN